MANLWITTVNVMCYSIYLLHNYAIAAAGRVREQIGAGGYFAFTLTIQFFVDHATSAYNLRSVFSSHRTSLYATAMITDFGVFLVRPKVRWSVVSARAAGESDADVNE